MLKIFQLTRIRYKLVIAFLLLILCIVALVIVFSYNSSISIIKNKSIELNDKLIKNGIAEIDSELNSIRQVVYSLFRNETFVESIPQSGTQNEYTFYDTYNLIGVSMQEVLAAKSNIFSIIYIDNQNNLIYCTRNKTSYERAIKREDMPIWLTDAIEDLNKLRYGYILIPTHPHLALKNDFSVIDDLVYTYACPALDVNNGYKSLGILLFNFNLSKLSEIAENVKPYGNSFTYIIGDDGTIVYDSTKVNTGEYLRTDIFEKIKSSDNYFTSKINDERYVVVYTESAATKWKILSFVPVSEYSKDINHMTKQIILIAALAISLSIVLILLFSKQLSTPIENLSKVMNKIEDGNINLRVEEKGDDEIGTLSRNFNSLISRLNYVMKNEYELTIRQKDAELKALQAQINPHFLFNVLQSINSIAELHNINEISTMATSLGKIMRYSIKTNDNIVSIKDEIKHVRHFLDIQKIRFGDKINYQVDVLKELMEYSILKLTLLPVVENAIIHGFKNNETRWILIINAYLENGYIVFDVSDNGIGMTEDKLKKLLDDLGNSSTGFYTNDFPSIGLKNVFYRLKIFYGNDAEMIIDSEAKVGTHVRLRFPAIHYKEVSSVDSNDDRGR